MDVRPFDALLLVSVGTGVSDPSQAPSRIAATGAIRALFSLMDDCASLVETVRTTWRVRGSRFCWSDLRPAVSTKVSMCCSI